MMTPLERAVFDAAIALTDVKREADRVFRCGLEGMPALVRANPVARQLADRTSAAGKRLEKAVDEYRRHS